MGRFWFVILISVVIIFVYGVSFIVAYKLGLQKDELLKSLTSTVPSVLSALVAIFIALFASRRQTIDWQIVSTQIDWRIRVRMQVINFRSVPIYDLSVKEEYPSFRWIQSPPESIPSFEKDFLIFEFGQKPAEREALNQTSFLAKKRYRFLIVYRDGSKSKEQKKPIYIKNPMYIPFAHMRLFFRKVKKSCQRSFSIGQGH